MSTERTPTSDKDLWQSLALDRGSSPVAVSDLDFAAWLEGRLPETEAARIDAAVTRDPALRAAALELADILGKPLPAAPSRMAVRARALVGFATERPARRESWFAALLPSFGEGFSLQRGVMAGAAVMVAAVGFMLGGGLGESFAKQKYASAEASVVIAKPFGTDTSNQLNDLFTDSI
jgi:hypothetical protein